jgi:glycosyltransferase involved in cell wall biosynthesis
MSEWDVSIVIPTLPEREDLLANALKSVNSQTYSPTEVIVQTAEDGDDAGVTRNFGVERTTTPWIAFLDDDDELEPHHLEVLVAGAQESGADVVYPWFKIIQRDGTIKVVDDKLWVPYAGMRISGFGLEFDKEARSALSKNCFIHLCCLIRKSKFEEAGGFPRTDSPEWPEPHGEDWALWLRFLKKDATFHHVADRTWHWRHWDGRTNGQPYRRRSKNRARV